MIANEKLTIRRRAVEDQYRMKEIEAGEVGRRLTYPQQDAAAGAIQAAFEGGKTVVSFIAPPQWGKTGAVLKAAVLMTKTICDPDHVFFVSGMNDTDWVEQTRERVIEKWQPNVLHRSKLELELTQRLVSCRDVLLIVDESHIASESDQTVSKVLQSAAIMNIDFLKERNIRILHVSATPSAVLVQVARWGEHHQKIVAELYDEYTSFQTMFDDDRVRMADDLNRETITAYFEEIQDMAPAYHIMRIKRHAVETTSLIQECASSFRYDVIRHDSESRLDDRRLFSMRPSRPTIILIKDLLRAARTLDDRYIGSVYENTAKQKDDNAEVQGLAGRLCGAGKRRGPSGPKIYCNPDQLIRYMDLYEKGFDYALCDHRSRPLKSKKEVGIIKCRSTMMDPTKVEGLVALDEVQHSYVPPATAAPIRRVKTLASSEQVPDDATWLTKCEMQPLADWLARFRLTPTSPALSTANALASHLKRHNFEANVSFTDKSAEKRSSIDNHYKRPEWARQTTHIYKDKRSSRFVTVTKDMALMEALRTMAAGRTYYAHCHDGRVGVYETV